MKSHRKNIDIRKNINRINSAIDIIPFITMKFLSQKQIESKNQQENFQKKYGFTFREYELLNNIIEKHKKNDETCISDVKSALTALKNSTNENIRNIFSKIDDEAITKKVLDNLITILEFEEDIIKLYQLINFLQSSIDEEKPQRIIPPLIDLLSNLASINHETRKVYNPTGLDAQTITSLETFEHATVYIKDENEYYHAKQNLLINDIPEDKISLYNKKVLIDEDKTRYDTIISVPYKNARKTKYDNIEKYDKFNTKNINAIHLLNLIDHLAPDGIIVTTTPQDLLVKKDTYNIRKYLIEENLIDTIIDYDTGYRSRDITILILNNNKKRDDFLFMKCPQFLPGIFIEENHKFILESYKKHETIDKFSNIKTKEEIIKNDYNLNPKRYVYTLDYEKKDMDELTDKQKQISEEIKKLDNEIEDKLNKIKKQKR